LKLEVQGLNLPIEKKPKVLKGTERRKEKPYGKQSNRARG